MKFSIYRQRANGGEDAQHPNVLADAPKAFNADCNTVLL